MQDSARRLPINFFCYHYNEYYLAYIICEIPPKP